MKRTIREISSLTFKLSMLRKYADSPLLSDTDTAIVNRLTLKPLTYLTRMETRWIDVQHEKVRGHAGDFPLPIGET